MRGAGNAESSRELRVRVVRAAMRSRPSSSLSLVAACTLQEDVVEGRCSWGLARFTSCLPLSGPQFVMFAHGFVAEAAVPIGPASLPPGMVYGVLPFTEFRTIVHCVPSTRRPEVFENR